MKISVKTKAGLEISGKLSTITKYIISIDVENPDAPQINSLTHLDGAEVTVYRNYINIIIDVRNVQHYTIY